MSVYIKNMEMPTHCMDCPFMVSHDNDDCILQSDEANEGFENWEQMKDGCPLVLVPPHRRLGDLDAIMIKLNETSKRVFGNDSVPECSSLSIVADYIDAAPTIIPASMEDE